MADATLTVLHRLKRNAEQRAKLLQERDELIWEARYKKLATVTDLADASGLSRTQVHRIIEPAWLVARESDGEVLSWHATEGAAQAASSAAPGSYYRKVLVKGTDPMEWE